MSYLPLLFFYFVWYLYDYSSSFFFLTQRVVNFNQLTKALHASFHYITHNTYTEYVEFILSDLVLLAFFFCYITDQDDELAVISARPRRMSEINNPPTQIMPIPPASSFFIFSQNNRLSFISIFCICLLLNTHLNRHTYPNTCKTHYKHKLNTRFWYTYNRGSKKPNYAQLQTSNPNCMLSPTKIIAECTKIHQA